jgi:hypothetical protein
MILYIEKIREKSQFGEKYANQKASIKERQHWPNPKNYTYNMPAITNIISCGLSWYTCTEKSFGGRLHTAFTMYIYCGS